MAKYLVSQREIKLTRATSDKVSKFARSIYDMTRDQLDST